MAYATIAGLPVQAGLYTALVPMVIYAVLGSSRVLSVTTTTTIAILTGANLALVAPGGDPDHAAARDGHAEPDGRRPARAGIRPARRILRRLHLGAGALRLQGRHRHRDRARSAAEAARCALSQGLVPAESPVPVPEPARDVRQRRSQWASRCSRCSRPEAFVPRVPAPLVAIGAGIAAMALLGLEAYGVETFGDIPRGLPALTLPDAVARRTAVARRPGHCAHELHRDRGVGASLRAERGAGAAAQPGVAGHGHGHGRRGRPRRHAGGWRHVPDRRQPHGRRAQPAGRPDHGRRDAADPAVPCAASSA